MKKKLEIELRSDLCAGTGKHYAAVIDLDTALDEYGIPYIPARRLKGCMREVAADVLGLQTDALDALFGKRGSGEPGSLRITDARINAYDSQLEEIRAAIRAGAVKANDITELFCSVRAETALENDTAKDGSLRFTRVVNRVSPVNNGEALKFYADIAFADANTETVTKICKGLRNIGYKRNRGLGHVRCRLIDETDTSGAAEAERSFDKDKRYRLDYLVFLSGDLMLPGADANHSIDYVPGTSVLGALAAKYIRSCGGNELNETEFGSLFHSEKVRFGNLYLSDKNHNDYVPAPRFLAKIKAAGQMEGGVQNMIANEETDAGKDPKPQYKPFKNGYVSETQGYAKVETEIVYHNALNTAEALRNKGGLYTQNCISSGQYFKGSIEADGGAMGLIYPLFRDRSLSFGRSKTAQYSHCEVKWIETTELTANTTELCAGNTAAFLFESDAVLTNGCRYTVRLEDVLAAVNKAVGAPEPVVRRGDLSRFTSLSTRVISGYNAKWNLKKPQFPAIRAGSVVIFNVENDIALPEYVTIGGRQNEGYGKIRLIGDAKGYLADYIKKEKEAAADNNDGQKDETARNYPLADSTSELLRALAIREKEKDIVKRAVEDAPAAAKKFNPSQTGRLTLMCKESKSADDFEKRINSIKTESFRNGASSWVLKKTKEYALSESWELAKKYALTLLTVVKYALKEKEGK